MRGGVIAKLQPNALEGMTEKQAEKMSQDFASELDRAQIRSLSSPVLLAMSASVFDVIEPELSGLQLGGLEALVGGDSENIGGPII